MDLKSLGETVKLSNCEISKIELDDEHFYYLFNEDFPEGKFIPSVTKIIDEAGPVGFGLREFWKNNTKQESEDILYSRGERGKLLHQDCERLIEGMEVELEGRPRYEQQAIASYVATMRFLKPENAKKEQVVASSILEVGGTLDVVCEINSARIDWLKKNSKSLELNDKGEIVVKEKLKDEFEKDLKVGKMQKWIIDQKFTSGIYYGHEAQVTAYQGMYNESYKDETPVKRKGIWRFSTRHKLGFEFKEVTRELDSFERMYETYLDLHGGELPKPPEIRTYPKSIRLFDNG